MTSSDILSLLSTALSFCFGIYSIKKEGLRGHRFPYTLEYNPKYASGGWLAVIRSIWLSDESLQKDFGGRKGQKTISFLRRHNLIKEDELTSAVTHYAQQQIAPHNHRSCPLAPVIFDRLTRNIIHMNAFGHLPRPRVRHSRRSHPKADGREKKQEKRSFKYKCCNSCDSSGSQKRQQCTRRWTHYNRHVNKVCCCFLTVTAGKKWWPKKMQYKRLIHKVL